MPPPATIRPAHRRELPDAARLLAENLRFDAADSVPPWFMRTTDECGGLTLVAVAGDAVVGALYAIPARRFLFTAGLAVAPAARGCGIGRELMYAQRRWAAANGHETIRWTADPVHGPALRLYLSRLGALITAYRPGLHDGLRADPGHPLDDVDVEWRLNGRPRLADDRPVQIPWPNASAAQRRRVRDEMSALLAHGYVGCAVELDGGRCAVRFARPCPTPR
jgi:predicted GNAT superfamily acetyltransferase